MISVHHVTKSFGPLAAVRDISFDVPRGQVVGLLGSNGAGKTTTIRMITGFLPPDAGTITIDGQDTIDQSIQARARIGYLPESAPAHAEMSVDDHLDFRARLFAMPRRDRRASIERVVGLCELADVRRRRVGHLSKGYRQRVGLAAALVHNPPVLVLDEPGNALDPRQIRHTRSIIRELGRDKAVLVSSHVLPEVELMCDRVIMMARGSIRLDADPRALLRDSADAPYIVECAGSPETARRALGSIAGVRGVAPEGQGPKWRITPEPGVGDLRESISRALAGAGLIVLELHRSRASLEQTFMSVIERTDDEA